MKEIKDLKPSYENAMDLREESLLTYALVDLCCGM